MAITRSTTRVTAQKNNVNEDSPKDNVIDTSAQTKKNIVVSKTKKTTKTTTTTRKVTTTVKRKAAAVDKNDNNEPKPKRRARKASEVTNESTDSTTMPTPKESQVIEEPSTSPSVITEVKEPKPKKLSKKAMAKAEMDKVLNEFPPELRELQGRLYRMATDRMIVVQRTIVQDFKQRFDVLGSTGNVYEVEIGQRLGCSCRDHIFRKKHCKHILLILLKVFHVNAHSPACHRLYLTREELAQVFENCTPDASVIANQQIQSTLESQLYGKNLPPVKEEGNEDGAKQRPLTTSDCPVCFEEFTEAERSLIVFCKSCGNNIHKACFEAWSTSGRSKITCVYCRAEWHDSKKKKKNNTSKIDTSHLRNQEGYVNVGSLVGMPEVRDVSSYGL